MHQQAIQGAGPRDEGGAFAPRLLAEGDFQHSSGKPRVEPRERIAQALRQNHLPVVVAFRSGFTGGDLSAVADLPADAFEPGERGFFYEGLGERNIHGACPEAIH